MTTNYTDGKLHFNSRNIYLTLFDNFVENEEDMNRLLNRLTQMNNNRAAYWVAGAIERGDAEQPHQHIFIKGKYPLEFNSKPFIGLGQGKTARIHYIPCSNYSTKTGDLERLIKYVKKEGTVVEGGDANFASNKVAWSTAINMALDMTSFDEAEQFLLQNNSEKFIQQEPRIKQKWYNMHKREKDVERIMNKQYNDWDYERNPELKVIKRWVGIAAKSKDKRMPILVIVGPTKTGKTSFMEKELYAKYPSFLMRGDYGWEEYNERIDYKFYILDDVNFYDKRNYLSQLKSIASSVDDENRIKVLYSHKQIKSRPTMILLNEKEWKNMRRDIFRNEGEDWWLKNMIVTHLNKRIYLTKDEMTIRNEAIQGVLAENENDAIDVYEFKDPAPKSNDKKPLPTNAEKEDEPIISKTTIKKKEERLTFRDRIINWMTNNDLPLTDDMKAALAQQNDELDKEEDDDHSMQEEDLKTMMKDYGLKNEDNTDLYPERTASRREYDAPQKRYVEEDFVDEDITEPEEDFDGPLYDEMMEENDRCQFRHLPEDGDHEVIYD